MYKWNPFTNNLDEKGDWFFGGNTLGSKKTIGSIDNQDFGIITNNLERLTVLKGGNVGIGTTNPVVKLTLQQGNQAFTPLWSAPTGDMAFGIAADTGSISGMDFKNFNSAGQVRLMARNDNNDYITMNAMGTNASAPFFGQRGDQLLLFGYGKRMAIGTWTPTPLILGTYNKEQMRIDTTGNVGIGTTSPTAKLHLAAGTATVNTAPLKFTSGTLNTTPELGAVEFVDDGTTGKMYITVNVGGVLTRKEIAFV